jgi:hypothetical protein
VAAPALAHISKSPQLHPLTGIGPRSCIINNRFRAFGGGPFVMLYRNNNEPQGKLYDR